MSRQVDVKALVSHIIKGDGEDRCRICMGDTSEGQVYLQDTVMMDGNRPVTLAELLAIITGVEVPMETVLPATLCSNCSSSALNAANFHTLCNTSQKRWVQTMTALDKLPTSNDVAEVSCIFAILQDDDLTVIDGSVKKKRKKPSLIPTNMASNRQRKSSEGPIICPECGKSFINALGLHTHMQESSDLKRACQICAQIMSREDLITHLEQRHFMKPLACNKCPAIFLNGNKYTKHVDKYHGKSKYECQCGRNFLSSHALNAHLCVHTARKCPSCDTVFRNQTCYFHHVKECCLKEKDRVSPIKEAEVENTNEKKINIGKRGSAKRECICDYCGKTYSGKKFVAAHIKIIHLKNTHRPCVYCGKSLAAARLTEHIKKHEQTLSFTCEFCGCVFRSRLGHIQHLRLHTGEKPYACQFCNKTFSASSRRSEHIRNIHKRSEIVLKHACEYCPARFRLPYKLRKHMAIAHSNVERDEGCFECEECYMQFDSYEGLVHHGEKHRRLVRIAPKPE